MGSIPREPRWGSRVRGAAHRLEGWGANGQGLGGIREPGSVSWGGNRSGRSSANRVSSEPEFSELVEISRWRRLLSGFCVKSDAIGRRQPLTGSYPLPFAHHFDGQAVVSRLFQSIPFSVWH